MGADDRLTQAADTLRARLWPVPLIGVVLAAAAGVALPELDRMLTDALPPAVRRHLFGGGAAEAREILGTVAASLITVTSLTFSLTLVTLQLASAQYSPRLLRTFSGDRFVQTTLAMFLATFTYALTVLRTIREGATAAETFVPHIAVSVAYLMALASVIALVFFLAHLVGEIRVETIMDTVRAAAVDSGGGSRTGDPSSEPARSVPQPPTDAVPILAGSHGFLTTIDESSLLSAAVGHDVVVFVDRAPGDWLVKGTPVAFVWSTTSESPLADERLKQLADNVLSSLHTGDERTPVQDVAYGLRQLTDVAIKALSPGINDPTTAVHALGHSSELLSELAAYPLGPKVLEADHIARVVIRRPTFADLLDLAVSQPRRYGARDAAVLARLFALLREVAWSTTELGQKSAVADQLARLRQTVANHDFDQRERHRLATLCVDAEAALAHSWRPAASDARV